MLTQEELKKQLLYCEKTGQFTWLVPKKGQSRKLAGYVRKDGYVKIVLNQTRYLAHRLAWLYVKGHFPKSCIDHINMNPNDNRIANLREATVSQNGANRMLQSNNKSGFKGINWDKQKNKWLVRIGVKGETIYLGLFDQLNDAAKAYKKAAIEFHGDFLNNNGVINE